MAEFFVYVDGVFVRGFASRDAALSWVTSAYPVGVEWEVLDRSDVHASA